MFEKLIIISIVSLFAVFTFIAADDNKPSLKIPENPNPTDDAKALCKELTEGWVVEPGELTKIICHRNFSQRNQTAVAFPAACENRNLLEKLLKVKRFTDKTENLMSTLFSYPSQLYQTTIQNIATGQCEDDGSITDIVCALNNAEKNELLKIYPEVERILTDYGLKKGGEYKNVLLTKCWAQRKDQPDPKVTDQIIETEANNLKTKNNAEFEQAIKTIFDTYGDPELQKIFVKFREINKDCELPQKILDTCKGNEKDAYETLVRSIENIYAFYAKLLRHYVKGGPVDSHLKSINRTIAIRCEIDLCNIHTAYKSVDGNFLDDLKWACAEVDYYKAVKKLFGDCA